MCQDRPLTAAQADHLAELASQALKAAGDRATAIAKGDAITPAEDADTYKAFRATTRALYEAIHALEHR